MTNTIALGLALFILALVALDLWLQTGALVFLMRKFVDLVRYVAFWR